MILTSSFRETNLTMRKILFFIIVIFYECPSLAQDVGLSADYDASLNRAEPLAGNGGILVISAFNDLIVQVTTGNSAGDMIRKNEIHEGNYEYIIPISIKDNNEAHFIFTRRGKTLKVEFSEKRLRQDYLYGYRVSAVANPIRLNYQPSSTDMYPSETEGLVQISTAIKKLDIVVPRSLPFKVTSGTQENDNSINVFDIIVPVAKIKEMKMTLQEIQNKYTALDNELIEKGNSEDPRWDTLYEMEDQIKDMENGIASVQQIYVTAPGSNTLAIDVSQMDARSKIVAAVVPLLQIETIQVSECSGYLEEGGRLFELREYEAAKSAFISALNAKDTPEDFKSSIQVNIAQCDTCLSYEQRTLGAISLVKKMQKSGGSQEELVKYVSAGIEYLKVLQRYNPLNFYSIQIKKLEDVIKEQPLELGLTITKMIDGIEADVLPNIEIWAFRGQEEPLPNTYRNDKKFKETVESSNNFELIGVSDKNGKADIQLKRDALPKGLLLHPIGYKDKIKAMYIDLNSLIRRSEGVYNKRRFNIKMYSIL